MRKIKQKRKILCPDCKTGMESVLIDETSPVCPYFNCYTGKSCAYYVPLKAGKKNIFSRLADRISGMFSN